MQRLRRLLLLIPAAARAERDGKGLPIARAVAITGARSEKELAADVEAVHGLWVDPGVDEDAIDLAIEDGEVRVTYAQAFGTPRAFSLAEGAVLLAALAPFEKEGGRDRQGGRAQAAQGHPRAPPPGGGPPRPRPRPRARPARTVGGRAAGSDREARRDRDRVPRRGGRRRREANRRAADPAAP
jgi:hypothetical protein